MGSAMRFASADGRNFKLGESTASAPIILWLHASFLNVNRVSLEHHSLDQFTKGWFVGRFHPTLVDTDAVEVAIKHYVAGDHEASHHHKVAVELTAIVSGRVRMSGEEFGPGTIIRIQPGQSTDFLALTDVVTVVVKLPCIAGDKYPDPA
jgi:hypothetical protein